MDLIKIVAIMLVGWICAYSIVVRICECVEKCRLYEVYGRCIANDLGKKNGDVGGFLAGMKEAMAKNGSVAGRNAESREK